MRKYLLMLCMFCVPGCVSIPALTPLEEMRAFAAEFDEEFGVVDSNINVWEGVEAFVDGIGGACVPSRNMIGINREVWLSIGQLQKRHLIYHEKLHCEFHIAHIDAVLPDGLPVSIMYPSMAPFREGMLKQNWPYYLKQAHSMIGVRGYRFD